jgi:WbqC-like protein family
VVWLTIPVGNQNDRRICNVEFEDQSWKRKHWMTIEQSYRRAPHFAPDVSIVDTLMCCGDRSPGYIWGYRNALEAHT